MKSNAEMNLTFNEKVASIQIDLKVHKGQKNNFGNYNYRSAEDILEALKPIQGKYRVFFQITEELIEIGGYLAIKSQAIINDLDSDDVNFSEAFAIIDFDAKGMQNPQRTGSASSYAKKYALGNLLLIDDTKDADATNEHNKNPKSKPKKKEIKLGDDGYKAVKKFYQQGKITEEKIKENYIISDVVLKELIKK